MLRKRYADFQFALPSPDRQRFMPVEEGFEAKAVAATIEIAQRNFTLAQGARALRSCIACRDREKLDFRKAAESLPEQGRLDAIAAGVCGIERCFPSGRMRMRAN